MDLDLRNAHKHKKERSYSGQGLSDQKSMTHIAQKRKQAHPLFYQ